MSSALLRKSLALCDPDLEEFASQKKRGKKIKKELKVKPRETQLSKSQVLRGDRKVTIQEAKANFLKKKDILKENLKRIKLMRKKGKVELNSDITEKLIERALTRKPIKNKPKEEKEKKTAFTEEDFKKFEEEYLDY